MFRNLLLQLISTRLLIHVLDGRGTTSTMRLLAMNKERRHILPKITSRVCGFSTNATRLDTFMLIVHFSQLGL